jgi:hypothetical protein
LLISVLTKKHLYAMQVCPRSFDHNRYAGIFINLHYIDLSVPSGPAG